jgi:hypothetical protein
MITEGFLLGYGSFLRGTRNNMRLLLANLRDTASDEEAYS